MGGNRTSGKGLRPGKWQHMILTSEGALFLAHSAAVLPSAGALLAAGLFFSLELDELSFASIAIDLEDVLRI